MEGKSTPGPWRPEPSRECVENVFDIRAGGAYGPCVAQWVDLNDAPIIAAAPEMLSALELAVKALNAAPRFKVGADEHGVGGTDSYKIAAVVDAAIAKAKGE